MAPKQGDLATTARRIDTLFIAGDLPAAQLAADTAYDQVRAHDQRWATYFLVERARIRVYHGETTEAVDLLTPPLVEGADPETVIRRDILLGMARGRLGDRIGSERAFADAEALHPLGLLASELLGFRGNVALGRGNLNEAEPLLHSALVIAEHENAKFQQSQMLMNLGVVALQRQHYEDASDRFHQASALAEVLGNKLAQHFVLDNLAFIYYRTGDFVRARDTSRQEATDAATQGSFLIEADSLKNAGDAAFQLNDLAAARDFYQKSLFLAVQIKSPEKMVGAHQALGYLLLHTDPAEAATHIHEATRLATERNHPGDILEQQFAESLLLAQQGQTQTAIARLRHFDQQPGALPSLYWQAEETLAKLYDQQHDEIQADLWFHRALATFSKQRRALHSVELKLPFLGNGDDLYFAYMDHLIQQQKTAQALDLLDQSRAETLADGLARDRQTTRKPGSSPARNTPAVTPHAVAAHLDATILVYCLRPKESYLWAITPTQETFFRLPGREVLLPLIKRHSQAILASTDLLARRESTGHQLYNLLVQPAASLQTGPPGRRVYVIADRELNDLNFETLIPPPATVKDKPHYWIEDVTLINARSLRLLAASTVPQTFVSKRNALLIGDPVYRDTEYPALPNASTEMSQIAQHFPTAARTVYTGPQAVPAAYAASTPGAFSYIHFVAHATSNETSPLDSAIVLSKSPTQPFAYRLYARDILDQRLHANLVTLSACYGSGRRNYSGEGLVGLAWAFLRAGAHNVIGALWQVSDASTPQLMDRLYTGLLQGDPPDAALRAAKLATIHAGGAFRKPLYWAPFQIYSGS